MEVQVEIERKDLAALNLYLLPRLRGNWIALVVLVAGILAYLLITRKPASPYNVGVSLFASVIGGVAGLLASYAVSVLMMLLTIGKSSGVLGRHHYTLADTGLREVTEANESLQKWSGFQDVIKVPNYILLRINGYLFHIVPRRAFSSEDQFQAFYERIQALRDAARRGSA